MVRTSGEHPFYVDGKGWTACNRLEAGDLIRTGGGWVPVGEVWDTGAWEVVYNVRVSDHHTYFVGDEGWDWSVWAHNSCEEIKQYRITNNIPEYTQGNAGTGTVAEVTVNGIAYYGRSENLGCLSVAQQEHWFTRMKSEGYLTGRTTLASAGFLRHAEAHALVNAYNASERLPTVINMYSDRPTCTYAYRKDLQELLKVMGVTNISIKWNNIQRPPLTWTAATGWL